MLRSPQSPRRALVRPIIPVHDAGLARVRVCLEGVGRGPAISSPHARRPDYSRTWCRPRARLRVCLEGVGRGNAQSPRRTLVCPIIPVYDAGLARVRVCLEGVGRGSFSSIPRTLNVGCDPRIFSSPIGGRRSLALSMIPSSMHPWRGEEFRFAIGSPLEGDGFELPVPGQIYSAAMRSQVISRCSSLSPVRRGGGMRTMRSPSKRTPRT